MPPTPKGLRPFHRAVSKFSLIACTRFKTRPVSIGRGRSVRDAANDIPIGCHMKRKSESRVAWTVTLQQGLPSCCRSLRSLASGMGRTSRLRGEQRAHHGACRTRRAWTRSPGRRWNRKRRERRVAALPAASVSTLPSDAPSIARFRFSFFSFFFFVSSLLLDVLFSCSRYFRGLPIWRISSSFFPLWNEEASFLCLSFSLSPSIAVYLLVGVFAFRPVSPFAIPTIERSREDRLVPRRATRNVYVYIPAMRSTPRPRSTLHRSTG